MTTSDTDETPEKRHRYAIIVPGSPAYKADVFAVNPAMDLQFAWEEDDGATRLAVVRFPTNVVIIDQECPESVERLKNSLEQFQKTTQKAHDEAMEDATKGVKLACYQ